MSGTKKRLSDLMAPDFVREMLLATTHKWFSPVRYRLHVMTGDKQGAGTDANVYVALYDSGGNKSKVIQPKTIFHNDHERACTTTVEISRDLGISPPFTSVEVWRDNFGNLRLQLPSFLGSLGKAAESVFGGSSKGGSAAWYLDRIVVEVLKRDEVDGKAFPKNLNNPFKGTDNRKPKQFLDPSDLQHGPLSSSRGSLSDCAEVYIFPVQRWIEAHRPYRLSLFDCLIPNEDPMIVSRQEEMSRKRRCYYYGQHIIDGPVQAAVLPSDEKFSEEYFWTFLSEKAKLLAKTTWIKWTTRKWASIEELKSVYKKSIGEPECIHFWDTDEWFALQRLQGVDPVVISLCKIIPENFGVTEDTVSGLLNGIPLKKALKTNRIFICDLKVVDGVSCKNNRKLASPIALFFLEKPNRLKPIAIQLQQQKGPQNPVFTPKDPKNTWLVAKMYYNNAEAQHHQGCSHLGFTHLLMEGACLCTHRNLSPSHPMFKLMAPHFLFLIAINARGLEKLISPGGWVDCCMTVGVEGIYEVIRRGIKEHRFFGTGNIAAEVNSRGVLNPEILPYYPYRDDALSLYDTIRKYVDKVVRNYYDTPEKLKEDWELKEWRQELSRGRDKGGVGLVDVPGDDAKGFNNIEELIDTVTIIISTCSLGHSAVNFQQYSQYGFVPNYPGILTKDPPTEKRDYTEAEIVELLPNMKVTLETMVITKLLSSRGTNSLGDFEMQYLYHPDDVAAADEFRKDLQKLSLEIQKRNIDRSPPFEWLDPKYVPNSISI